MLDSRVRLNLKVSQRVKERLTRLREKTDTLTEVEVIRQSLARNEALVDTILEGGEVILRASDGSERILFIPI